MDEIEKVRRAACRPAMVKALAAVDSTPAQHVHKFSELRKSNPDLTADQYGAGDDLNSTADESPGPSAGGKLPSDADDQAAARAARARLVKLGLPQQAVDALSDEDVLDFATRIDKALKTSGETVESFSESVRGNKYTGKRIHKFNEATLPTGLNINGTKHNCVWSQSGCGHLCAVCSKNAG